MDETIKTSVAVLKELLKSVPGTLIIGGIVISVSAVTLPFLIPSLAKMPDKVTWILFGFGIVVTATGIYLYLFPPRPQTLAEPNLPTQEEHGFKVIHPSPGKTQSAINGWIDFSGTYVKGPPPGYTVGIIERFNRGKSFAFRRDVELHPPSGTWRANAVWCGKQRGDKDFILVFLGHGAQALHAYWHKVGPLYKWNIPEIDTWPPDMLMMSGPIEFVYYSVEGP